MPVLAHFREYCAWIKSDKPAGVPKTTRDLINTAHARLRIAKRFRSLEIERVSETLSRGYSAGILVLLSYSAAETMGSAVGEEVKTWEITNAEIAPPLRRIAGRLIESPGGLKPGVIAQLEHFADGRNHNVRIVATALRHQIAHGHFAPAGKLSLAISGSIAVEKLCAVLNDETERRFAEWFLKKTRS
jgi:hypothetical protein